jgi:acyl carrier protein
MQNSSATSDDSVREALRSFVSQTIDISGLNDDVNLFETGIVNSLFAVQLMTYLEKAFRLELTMDDMDIRNFHSINATSAFVIRKLDAGRSAAGGAT